VQNHFFTQKDLEWKVVYVGSAESSSHDQTLDEILVGPVPVGINKFILQADAPDPSSIPQNDILGVTVILVTCSYREREFVRVGYYVNNEYTEEYDEEKGPPMPLDLTKVARTILADKPRVTRFHINWGDCKEEENIPQDGQSGGMPAAASTTTNTFSGDGSFLQQNDTEDVAMPSSE
jgi:histone chaperone ASF1